MSMLLNKIDRMLAENLDYVLWYGLFFALLAVDLWLVHYTTSGVMVVGR
jgi:hypothetical protein